MDLLIATFRIRFKAEDDTRLVPGERFNAFLHNEEGVPDIVISVNTSLYTMPEGAVMVFNAPLIEDNNGQPLASGKPFWNVWRSDKTTFVRVSSTEDEGEKALVMEDNNKRWELFLNFSGKTVDPLIYPVDGLILYYLTALNGAIMMHASAVNFNGRGWLFSGRSGSGKTTLAKLFDSQGIEVIHDDRVILVKKEGQWIIHSTPVYGNDVPRSALLDHIWLIEHGKSNVAVPIRGAMATAMVLANCIQQTWEGNTTEALLNSLEDLTMLVQVSKLAFIPDKNICSFLSLRKGDDIEWAFSVALSLLREGKQVMVTADGLSMWPAIRPDDKVIIEPINNYKPSTGEVVALIRVGGFVVHRLTKIVQCDGNTFYKTQGDASAADNLLSEEYEVAGTVKEIIRNGIRQKVKKRILPVWINWLLARGSFILQSSRVPGSNS